MAATEDLYIPPDEELTVQELTVSSPILRAIVPYMGYACDTTGKEYMLCKLEERDPRKCLKEGKDITACGLNFLQRTKQTCRSELTAFARCIEWNSMDMNFEYCRRDQAVLDECMLQKMNAPRAPFGYFSQMRIHDTKRPKPAPYVPEFPDKAVGLPLDYPGLKEPARHGTRFAFHP